jgi:TonB-linked SusC/RagA family outer membrane protein
MESPRVRMGSSAVILALLLAMVPAWAEAQATGAIRGSVLQAATNRPLSSAQVFIPGTPRSTLTNAAGEFLLLNVPVGAHTVRADLIGFSAQDQQVTVAAEQTANVTFTLQIDAVALDEIIVTGTAGATSKRTIGNAITKVDASRVTQQTAITSLTELLQAKSPGVQIVTNSGVLGTASEIRIRGAGSLTQTRPVVFIDGVRFNTEDLGTFTPSGAASTNFSGQATSAFDFINPNDIESIEIVKGPAAATLYGAEAANGVIQIITKKGRRGEQSVRWDLRTEYGQNDWTIDIPDNYTTCTQAFIDLRDAAGTPTWPGCQGLSAGTIITDNPLLRDPAALRTGDVRRMSLSARGGGERFSYYFAGDLVGEKGVFYNNYNDRAALRANFTTHPNSWLDVFVTSAYTRSNLRLPVGDESAQGMLLSAFRGRPGRVTTNPLNAGWSQTRAEQANAYDNTTKSDRLTLGTTVSVAPFSWMRNRLTLGFDYTSSLAQVLSPPGSVDADYAGFVSLGAVAQRVPRHFVYTIDYTGNIDRNLTADLSSTTSFGAQAVSRKYEVINATGTGLGAPDIELVSLAATTVGGSRYSENKSLGFYVQEMLGWKQRIFLTGAVRADDNSAFGESFNWIYYPKLQLSWVLSEEPLVENLFSAARVNSFKFRTAWGQAGQAPAPFSAAQTYLVNQSLRPDGTVVTGLQPYSFGNPDLKAERGSEIEIGFDAGLFQDRVGIEFTYYNKRMEDVIISQAPPGSGGFGSTFYGATLNTLRNLGETLNTGIEVALSASPVVTRQLAWEANLSLATNRNELVEFGDARTELAIGGQSYGNVQRHREGKPLGGYWVQLPRRDADGKPIPLTATTVQLDTLSYIGPPVPTREISFANTFTVMRDFRVFVLLDHKGGNYLWNYKEYNRCAQNTNCERVNDPALANHPDRPIWLATNAQGYWVEKADFVKLRDVSLTYTLPPSVARVARASAASFTVAGHNLAMWTDYTGLDPEVNGYGSRPDIVLGRTAAAFARADVFPVPMLRRWSVAMNVSF